MLLKSKNQPNIGAQRFSEWIEAIYDPIQKGFLAEAVFTIYTDSNNKKKLIEQYIFKIKWNEDGSYSMDLSLNKKKLNLFKKMLSKNDIRRETRKLFLQIMTLNNLIKPLPDSPSYSIQLFYNKRCPKNYEPVLIFIYFLNYLLIYILFLFFSQFHFEKLPKMMNIVRSQQCFKVNLAKSIRITLHFLR